MSTLTISQVHYSHAIRTAQRDFPPVASFGSELPILSHAPTTAIHFSAQQSLKFIALRH